jgi:hypothetical protein
MTDLSPVDAMTTPPEKLFAKWEDDILNERENVDVVLDCAWKNGFVAGADQELEACCEWLARNYDYPQVNHPLRTARRPKPPSLKERALSELDALENMGTCNSETIRRALEALDD